MTSDKDERLDCTSPSAGLREKSGSILSMIVSAAFVLVVNLIPIFGIVFFGWDVFTIVFVYWIETAVIGCFTLLKIVLALPGYDGVPGRSVRYQRVGAYGATEEFSTQQSSKRAIVPAFIAVFGGMTVIYGVFMFIFLGGPVVGQLDFVQIVSNRLGRLSSFSGGLTLVFGSMVVQQAVALWFDFFSGPEWVKSDPLFHAYRPVMRLVFLYFIVLSGAFIISAFSLPRLFGVLFIAIKTTSDMFSIPFASAGPWRRVL